MSQQEKALHHLTSISHMGQVIMVGIDADTQMWYKFQQSRESSPSKPVNEWKPLVFPNERDDQAVVAQESQTLTYQHAPSRFILRSRFSTQQDAALTSFYLKSIENKIYVFRQSKKGTLLVDRFQLVNNRLQHLKKGKKNEPTTELCLIAYLKKGWFSVEYIQTPRSQKNRWHIFAFNPRINRIELFTLYVSSEGLFDICDLQMPTPVPLEIPPQPGILKRQLCFVGMRVAQNIATTVYHTETPEGQPKSSLLLAIPTQTGTAILSFDIASDGALSFINDTPRQVILRDTVTQYEYDDEFSLTFFDDPNEKLTTAVKKLEASEKQIGDLFKEKQVIENQCAELDNLKVLVPRMEALKESEQALDQERQEMQEQLEIEQKNRFNYYCYIRETTTGLVCEASLPPFKTLTLRMRNRKNLRQLWKFVDAGDGTVYIRNRFDDRPFFDQQWIIERTGVSEETVKKISDPKWKLEKVNKYFYRIHHEASGLLCQNIFYRVTLAPSLERTRQRFWSPFTRDLQTWDIAMTRIPANDTLAQMETAFQNKCLQEAQKNETLAAYNQLQSMRESDIKATKDKLADISAQISELQPSIGDLDNQFIQDLQTNQTIAPKMKLIYTGTTGQQRGLITRGGMFEQIPADFPITLTETRKGSVRLSFQDTDGNFHQTRLNTVASEDGIIEEQWQSNAVRVCPNLQEGENAIVLDAPIALNSGWTIEGWFEYPQATKAEWRTLAGAQDQRSHQVVIYNETRLGIRNNGLYQEADCDLTSLNPGWHRLTVVGIPNEPTTHFYIDGQSVGKTQATSGLILSDSQHVKLPSMTLLPSQGITIEAWICPHTKVGITHLVELGDSLGNQLILKNSNLTPTLSLEGLGDAYLTLEAEEILDLNRWIHLAATVDTQGNATLYKNGNPLKTGAFSLPSDSQFTKNTIGKWQPSGPKGEGKISEVRIWNHCQTSEEIKANLGISVSGSKLGLIGAWSLMKGQFYDASPNRYHGITQGNPKEMRTTGKLVGVLNVIGNAPEGGQAFGKLSDIKVWNRALGETSIASLEPLEGDDAGLVAYFPLNELQGNKIYDHSGNQCDASILDPREVLELPKIEQGQEVTQAESEKTDEGFPPHVPIESAATKVLKFDGQKSYITVPNSSVLQIQAYTVETWIKPEVPPKEVWTGIVGKPGRNHQMWIGQGGFISHTFHTSVTWAGLAPFTKAGTIQWGKWHHVAITNDGTTARTYINGTLEAEGPTGGELIVDATDLNIGRNLDTGQGGHFQGLMSELRLWNKVRTAEEIQADFHKRLTGKETGLVAYWPLDRLLTESGSSQIEDLAGNQTGTTHNVQQVPDKSFTLAESPEASPTKTSQETPNVMHFDGQPPYLEVFDSPLFQLDQYTVELWMKPHGKPNEAWKGIFGKSGRNFNIWLHSNGFIHHRFHTAKSTNVGAPDTPANSIQWDTWNHVAITNDGNTAKTYINGKLSVQGPTGGTLIPDKGNLYIGRNLDGNNGNLFKGLLTEIRLWKNVRSEQAIQATLKKRLIGNEENLVAYWPLNKTLQDGKELQMEEVVSGNHAKPHGVRAIKEDVLTFENEKITKVARLAGQAPHLEVPENPALRVLNYTVELWMKPDGTPNETWKGVFGKPGRNFNIWLHSSGFIHHRFHTNHSTNAGAPNTPNGSIKWNEWSHVAITNDGSTAKTYINGNLMAEGPTGGTVMVDNTPLYMARNLDGGNGNYFKGQLAEVRLWKKVRTAEEIQADLNKQLTGEETDLAAYWPLNASYVKNSVVKVKELVDGHAATAHGAVPYRDKTLALLNARLPSAVQLLKNQVTEFNGSVKDYIIANPVSIFPKKELTVEFWIKTEDTTRVGSILSYAVTGSAGDNEFVIDNAQNLRFTFRKQMVSSEVPFNDGQWHHCAVTWVSKSGLLAVYKDGKDVFSTHIGRNLPRKSNGALVLGQEQDRVAGGFDARQAFLGRLSEVRIWNKVRTLEAIQATMNQRMTGNEGALVIYWPLDDTIQEGDTTKAHELTGNLNSTVHGTKLVAETELPFASESALPKQAMYFDGTDDVVSIPDHNTPLDAITVSVWAKSATPNWNNHGCLVSKRNAFVMHPLAGSKTIQFYVYSGGWCAAQIEVPDVTQWHQYTGTFDGKTIRLFIDGKEVAQTQRAGKIGADSGPMFIGWDDLPNYGRYFNGWIAEVSVWNHAKSQAMIAAGMKQCLKENESDLVGYWPLSHVYQESEATQTRGYPSNLPGTVTGAIIDPNEAAPLEPKPSALPKTKKVESQVMLFDGENDYIEFPQDLPAVRTEITIEFWAKGGTSLPKYNSVIEAHDTNNQRILNIHLAWLNGHIYWDAGGSGYDRIEKAAHPDEYKDAWNHWAFVKNAATGEMKIYRNGILWHQGTGKTKTIPAIKKFVIGAYVDTNNRWVGSLSEFRIWHQALSAEAIQSTMHQRLIGNEDGLSACWSLDAVQTTGESVTIKDKVSNITGMVHGTKIALDADRIFEVPLSEHSTVEIKTEETRTEEQASSLKTANATVFDGKQAMIVVASSPTFEITEGTLEAWVKLEWSPGANQYNPAIMALRDQGGCRFSLHVADDYSKIMHWNGRQVSSFAVDLKQSEWNHIALTVKGSTMTAYLNGIACGSHQDNFSNLTGKPFHIGSSDGIHEFFTGALAEIRVWNYARTEAIIKAEMSRYLRGNETGLVGYFPLNSIAEGATTQGTKLILDDSFTLKNAAPVPNIVAWGVCTAPIGVVYN